MKKFLMMCMAAVLCIAAAAQGLRPGFNVQEYRDALAITARFGDSNYYRNIPGPDGYQSVWLSPVTGLENRWSLWLNRSNGVAVICIRGTVASSTSWLANFYAATVPATGSLQLSENQKWNYSLSTDERSAVHVGWLLSTAYVAPTVLQKTDSLYRTGTKNFIITGHSQGGAIAYLLTAYLYRLQQTQNLPSDIRLKTYCSAAPKPGNLYFAYNYEALTQGGWAYNVVNTADWVPETPSSIQTLKDLNPVNPFNSVDGGIGGGSFFQRLALKYAFNKLRRPTEKAQRNYEKYLGRFAGKQVQKVLPDYKQPAYAPTNNYVRTGNTIVLYADSAYYHKFPNDPKQVFIHHSHQAYLYLTQASPPTPLP